MRKASYFIWVFIITLIAIAAGIQYFPADASHATSSNMAYMGIGAAIAMIFFIALFPLASLAYLLNWQALFKQTTPISKWRYVEALLFFIPALLIGSLWAMEVWGKNEWVTLLAAASALPIIIFGVINFVYFIRNKNMRAGQSLSVLVCFFAPAMLVVIYLSVNYAHAAWKLEIISRFQDLKPQLVLAGVSDKTVRIKADLMAYPEVRKALEQGRTLRLSNAVGSSLLELREINSGELILYGMGNSFKYAQPKFTCQDQALLAGQ